MHRCAVVSKRFEVDLDGNFWLCEAFEAVNIGTVDYCGIDFHECSSLQVISTGVTTSIEEVLASQPSMDYQLHPAIISR